MPFIPSSMLDLWSLGSGGGIPVIETETGDITGVEAVIDKDFGSSLLATMIGADLFVISTAVEQVALNFNTPQARVVRMTLAEARNTQLKGILPKDPCFRRLMQSSSSWKRRQAGDHYRQS